MNSEEKWAAAFGITTVVITMVSFLAVLGLPVVLIWAVIKLVTKYG
jgi:flagellar biogenesis protein FliO